MPHVCECGGIVRSKGPLRRRLFCGGCSRVEYQQIAVRGCCPCSVRMLFFGVCPGTVGMVVAGLVFGTLLGPEATGPGRVTFPGLFVSGFLAASITHFVCVGCVVWGCCLRTTLWTRASFIRSNFQEYEPGSVPWMWLCCAPFCGGVGVAVFVVWFSWFSRELVF